MSLCSNGENSRCSQWSPTGWALTPSVGTSWYVSPEGSYLYGNGLGPETPFPADLQGVIDRADIVTGHEIILMPGVYSDAQRRGPGQMLNLNLRGKLITMRSLAGAASTVFDCGGSSRFFTFDSGEPGSVCLLYTSPSPRDKRQSRMPSSA